MLFQWFDCQEGDLIAMKYKILEVGGSEVQGLSNQ